MSSFMFYQQWLLLAGDVLLLHGRNMRLNQPHILLSCSLHGPCHSGLISSLFSHYFGCSMEENAIPPGKFSENFRIPRKGHQILFYHGELWENFAIWLDYFPRYKGGLCFSFSQLSIYCEHCHSIHLFCEQTMM